MGAACKRLGLPLHCDGARLLNAAVSQGVEVSALLRHCDSASICLSKVRESSQAQSDLSLLQGLGCPVGSVIVGSRPLIEKAIRLRKVLGGAMRQSGVLAAAGLFALEHNVARLEQDHRHATEMAEIINQVSRQ